MRNHNHFGNPKTELGACDKLTGSRWGPGSVRICPPRDSQTLQPHMPNLHIVLGSFIRPQQLARLLYIPTISLKTPQNNTATAFVLRTCHFDCCGLAFVYRSQSRRALLHVVTEGQHLHSSNYWGKALQENLPTTPLNLIVR